MSQFLLQRMSAHNDPSVLLQRNAHERDAKCKYVERTHTYSLLEDKTPFVPFVSATSFVREGFHPFDANSVITNMRRGRNWNELNAYWGMTDDEIKAQWKTSGEEAARAGTALHARAEYFMNSRMLTAGYTHADLLQEYIRNEEKVPLHHHGTPDEESEWRQFIQFVAENPTMKPFRTEWRIYDEHARIAGTIDMTYINEDGSLSLYDWKRSKEINSEVTRWSKYNCMPELGHILDSNYWHYALQLNTYRHILESHYGYHVRDMTLVRVHPNISEAEVLSVPRLETETTYKFNLAAENVSNKIAEHIATQTADYVLS